jgi:hypothetical protein
MGSSAYAANKPFAAGRAHLWLTSPSSSSFSSSAPKGRSQASKQTQASSSPPESLEDDIDFDDDMATSQDEMKARTLNGAL